MMFSSAALLLVVFTGPALLHDDMAPDLDAPLPTLDVEESDDDQEPTAPPSMRPGDAPPPLDSLPKTDPTDDQRTQIPEPDAVAPVDDAGVPWPWSTTIGSIIGAAVPSVILGGSGTAIGACGLFLIGSGIAQGGCGGLVLVVYGLAITILALPVMLAAAVLTPVGTAIGTLVGGAVDERFAWQPALGATLGFLPALGAVTLAGATYVMALNIGSIDTQEGQLRGITVIGALVAATVLVLLTGPTAVVGAALAEQFTREERAVDLDEEPESAAAKNAERDDERAKKERRNKRPRRTPTTEESKDVENTPLPPPPSTFEGAEPPPMLSPQLRY
jgi:hypothetical protein